MSWRLPGEVEDEALLTAAGLTSVEARAYRALLEGHPQTLVEMAKGLDTSRADAERTLRSLEAKGLVTREAGATDRFLPVSPSLAIEGLVLRRQDELSQIRALAQRLEEEVRFRSLRDASAQLVEVLDTPEVVGERALQLLRAAKEEFLGFDKPPYTTSAEDNDPTLEDALARGVRTRAIYDRESLMAPPAGLGLEHIRYFQSRGEEGRVFPHLPFKMNITDRTTALLPLVFEESGSVGGALVVHSPHLVGALAALWEILWKQALPIPGPSAMDEAEPSIDSFLAGNTDLINLLLAGAKTATIAHQLGIGTSTVERRVRRLMQLLGAGTRLQAGFQLARRMPDL